jgi:hypothetical protein
MGAASACLIGAAQSSQAGRPGADRGPGVRPTPEVRATTI